MVPEVLGIFNGGVFGEGFLQFLLEVLVLVFEFLVFGEELLVVGVGVIVVDVIRQLILRLVLVVGFLRLLRCWKDLSLGLHLSLWLRLRLGLGLGVFRRTTRFFSRLGRGKSGLSHNTAIVFNWFFVIIR